MATVPILSTLIILAQTTPVNKQNFCTTFFQILTNDILGLAILANPTLTANSILLTLSAAFLELALLNLSVKFALIQSSLMLIVEQIFTVITQTPVVLQSLSVLSAVLLLATICAARSANVMKSPVLVSAYLPYRWDKLVM